MRPAGYYSHTVYTHTPTHALTNTGTRHSNYTVPTAAGLSLSLFSSSLKCSSAPIGSVRRFDPLKPVETGLV